ncbi:pathogenesis-related protein 1B-like [Silene latifolia]|uniref:pathogenesis-related protein 1B-like n=1 Tax=Silene latifolia TaxID=37657 RepID=UPI003D76F8A0
MNYPKPYQYLFSCLIIVTIALIEISHAQNSPQDYVDAHNAARDAVGVGPIEWDDTVAAYAQEYANSRINDCLLEHSSGPYGENLAQGSGDFMTGIEAIKLWVDEQVDYDYNSNTCADGKVCGHYTQVVWRDSIRLGCARVECDNGWYYVTCNYDPPGNFVGQWPY